MKYIVTYLIIKLVIVPCPAIRNQDEFGRSSNIDITTAVICTQRDTAYKLKEFDNRKDAIDFIKRGEDKKAAGWNPVMGWGELLNFKLDSIKLKSIQ